ncbi:hypothetical protein PAXINDRAFT_6841 [Paxillus involutus ATCC 200175]|nr:hypothetical protein PAXINDRAFT_6841 [Paxillus involutus ATCC 200175]
MANAKGGISDWSTAPEEKPQSSSGDDVTVGQDIDVIGQEINDDDARDEPDWLYQPATVPPNVSGDIAEVSRYAPGDSFWADMEDTPVEIGKGKTKAQDVTSADELDSAEQRQPFGGFNSKILKPLREVGKSLKLFREHTEGSASVPAESIPARLVKALRKPPAVPTSSQAQIEHRASEPIISQDTSSIHSPGAGPSHQQPRPSLWRSSQSSSPTLQVTPIAAGRAKRLLAGVHPPRKRLPRWLNPDDPKNKPWHKYVLNKQAEHLALRTGAATLPISPGDKPLPPVPSSPSAANVGTSSTPQQGAQPLGTPTPAQPGAQPPLVQTRRPPSEISFTRCGIFCLWFWRSEPRWNS